MAGTNFKSNASSSLTTGDEEALLMCEGEAGLENMDLVARFQGRIEVRRDTRIQADAAV